MSSIVKAALIVAAAILLAAGAMIYFSEFQTCVRGEVENHVPRNHAEEACLSLLNPGRP